MGGKRPVIAVAGPDRGGFAPWLLIRLAVLMAGGRAVRVTPGKRRVPPYDGLILSGGADVAPGLYGMAQRPDEPMVDREERSTWLRLAGYAVFPLVLVLRRLFSLRSSARFDTARDRMEYGLLDEALARDTPVLGICRGAQLLNVYLGGNLHQDIAGFYEETVLPKSALPTKRVFIEPGSLLHRTLDRQSLRVNALHHQAVRNLGHGLKATAREANGVIQAVEGTDNAFLLGVQWHPEFLPHLADHRAIFKALVGAC